MGLKLRVELDLGACPISNEGVRSIAALMGLERLSLSGSDITDAAIEELVKLPVLKALDLNSTDIGDAGPATDRDAMAKPSRTAPQPYSSASPTKVSNALKTLNNLEHLDLCKHTRRRLLVSRPSPACEISES